MGTLQYRGIRRSGSAGTGAVDANDYTPAWLAKQLYDKGWRELTITRNVGGDEVGGIGLLDGKREWWGECVT